MLAYLFWHYKTVNSFLIKNLPNYFAAVEHFFSLRILLSSLFSPWRRVSLAKKPGRLFLSGFFKRLTFNLISRGIGFALRAILIFLGLAALVTVAMTSFLFFLSWQIFLPFSLPIYFWYKLKGRNQAKMILKKSKTPAAILANLLKRPIGGFVCERLIIDKKELISLTTKRNQWSSQGVLGQTPKELEKIDNLETLFHLLARDWLPLRNFLFEKKLKPPDIFAVAEWYGKLEKKRKEKARFWEKSNLIKSPGLGWNFSYGYTPELDKYIVDLTIPQPFSHRLVGRRKEVAKIEEILSRREENNVLLVGEPGVGKNTIVLSLARKVFNGSIRPELTHKRILGLNLNQVVGRSTISQAKTKLLNLLKEAVSAGNIVLIISNIDKFAVSRENRIDLIDVFNQISRSSRVQVIGISTPENHHRYLASNALFLKLFEKVEVFAPDKETALEILMIELPYFEKGKKIKASYKALKQIVELSDKLIVEVPFPEKAIDLLDEAVTRFEQTGKKLISAEDISQLVSEKTKVPIASLITEGEKKKLLNLENDLHQRVINQESAIGALASAMRRTRLQVASSNKPIGSFLFLGPTGVGKTETAKALAHYYFGSEKRMIRFDMSQYQQQASLDGLIGSREKGSGLLLEKIKDNPFSVLLLDELEKADKRLLNIFLTVFDEGYLTDYRGKNISFCDTIIIATSNAAAEFIRQQVKLGVDQQRLQTQIIEYVQRKGIFLPEFLNRFDSIVVFKPLAMPELKKIAELQLGLLAKRLSQKDIILGITPQLVESVAENGYSPEFGARPMKRWIADKIEDKIAKAELSDKIKRGNKVVLLWDKGEKEYQVENKA